MKCYFKFPLRDQHKRLQEKLKAVEGKIIVGGVNLVSGIERVIFFCHLPKSVCMGKFISYCSLVVL